MADEDKEMTLAEKSAAERDYYLGKTDQIPEHLQTEELDATTVPEAREQYRDAVAAADADLAKRMKKYQHDPEDDPEFEEPPVNVTDLPDEDALAKLTKNDLVEQAVHEGLDVDATATKSDIIEAILKHREVSE